MNTLEWWIFLASRLERARQSIKTQRPVADLGEGAFMTRNKDTLTSSFSSRKEQ
jgi:hypothetical protein